MIKRKWTPGPWWPPHMSQDDVSCNCRYVLSECYCGSIASIEINNGLLVGDGGNDAPPLSEAKANGFLIAAAPELYEALEVALTYVARANPALAHDIGRLLTRARGEDRKRKRKKKVA